MKGGLHPWGVFEQRWKGRGLPLGRPVWVLLSHHKTSRAADQRARPGLVVCRIASFAPAWERP